METQPRNSCQLNARFDDFVVWQGVIAKHLQFVCNGKLLLVFSIFFFSRKHKIIVPYLVIMLLLLILFFQRNQLCTTEKEPSPARAVLFLNVMHNILHTSHGTQN